MPLTKSLVALVLFATVSAWSQTPCLSAGRPTPIALADMQTGEKPWAAVSGLAADKHIDGILYAVEDKFYPRTRILTLNARQTPAKITQRLSIKDSRGLLAQVKVGRKVHLVNKDNSVNLDAEGIAVAASGGFWVVSEGHGRWGKKKTSPNLLLKISAEGEITAVIQLPAALNADQRRFGFEGVAEQDGKVYVAFQRPWKVNGKKEPSPRIGIYDLTQKTWTFVYYPLDKSASSRGKVGVSDIAPAGNGRFYVLERSSHSDTEGNIRRIYAIDLHAVKAKGSVDKHLVCDVSADFQRVGMPLIDKLEGLAITPAGAVYLINDNDGDERRTQLMRLR